MRRLPKAKLAEGEETCSLEWLYTDDEVLRRNQQRGNKSGDIFFPTMILLAPANMTCSSHLGEIFTPDFNRPAPYLVSAPEYPATILYSQFCSNKFLTNDYPTLQWDVGSSREPLILQITITNTTAN